MAGPGPKAVIKTVNPKTRGGFKTLRDNPNSGKHGESNPYR